MSKYRIQVKLLTEAIFGCGYSIPGSVDLEIVHDEYGLPYMKAKTFKGNFREAMEDVITFIGDKKYETIKDKLLGKEGDGLNTWRTIKFSHCTLSKNITDVLKYGVDKEIIKLSEVKEALTNIRSFTSVEDSGAYREGSLRHMRVVKKDLVFYVNLYSNEKLTEDELGLLAITSKYLRHISTMRTRGKGEVECSFQELVNGEYQDKTDYYMNKLLKGVKGDG